MKFHDKYFYRDGEPKRCYVCISPDISSRVMDTIESHVCEEEHYCKKCGSVLAYWAYGYFSPDWLRSTESELKSHRQGIKR